ncbi:MAG: alpha/beta hydrolase [Oscillospiraceae bacterium]|nr:alpha/beta hydrolase [Oscillospiraceae bacterium]
MKKSITDKAGKALLIIFCAILLCLLFIIIYFLIKSPGKIAPFLDDNGVVIENSISEKIFVEINGIRQGMFIRGEDKNNPILLFIHGGPGMPEYFLADKYQTGLEKYFTVCYPEQRGAGLSYNSDISGEDLTVSQLVSDTIEVANYLCERFGQGKVYLMGHSWGSLIGIQAAASSPKLFHAYIGMSQLAEQTKSETIAYHYMKEKYSESGNKRKIREFEKHDISNKAGMMNYFTSALRDNSMHELGIGTMRQMRSVVIGVFFPVMNCRAYTFSEKINIWVAKSFLSRATNLQQELLDADLMNTYTDFEIPIYFIAGKHDYTTNYGLQKEYFNQINAPLKGFYTFENSAHSPLFEEPRHFIEIVNNDMMNGVADLAD